jgi:neprilysin
MTDTLQNSASLEEPVTENQKCRWKLGIDKKTGWIIVSVIIITIILIALNKYGTTITTVETPADTTVATTASTIAATTTGTPADTTAKTTAATTDTVPQKNEDNFINPIRNKQAQIMKSYMNPSINPCDDFYRYACGNWTRNNQIPQDTSKYSTLGIMGENLDSALRALLQVPETELNSLDSRQLEANLLVKSKSISNKLFSRQVSIDSEDDAEIKAKNLYSSCINQHNQNKRDIQPLTDLLNKLGGWPALSSNWKEENFDWLNLTAQLRLYNKKIFMEQWVGPDMRNFKKNIINFEPIKSNSRDLILLGTNKTKINAYAKYMETIINLMGADPNKTNETAVEILDFETQLAKIISQDSNKYWTTLEYLIHNLIPQFKWQRYLEIVMERPVKMSETVLYAKNYTERLIQLINKTKPRTVANYLMWQFVYDHIGNWDDRFLKAKQKFDLDFFGIKTPTPRWKLCVQEVNKYLPQATGAMFVREHFENSTRKDTLTMMRKLHHAFQEYLNENKWIDPETKRLVMDKLMAMTLKNGYPVYILSIEELNNKYHDIKIHPDKYFENTLSIQRHLARREQLKLEQPVNETLWEIEPVTVNAFYNVINNQIVFPAGILQQPIYHLHFPKALNYGAIGMVIGELFIG